MATAARRTRRPQPCPPPLGLESRGRQLARVLGQLGGVRLLGGQRQGRALDRGVGRGFDRQGCRLVVRAFLGLLGLVALAGGTLAVAAVDEGPEAEIELVTDRAARRYVARTLNGVGAPTEIWTHLDPQAKDRTTIRVEFCVQPLPEQTLRALGKSYFSLYTTLWSQDESMMQTREVALREASVAACAFRRHLDSRSIQ